MRRLYLVLALLIALLGLVHTAMTARLFDELNNRAIWFASAALLLILVGALNLLNRDYGARAPGLRWTTVGTNIVMAVLAVLGGIAGSASGAQLAFIIGLMAATTLVSLIPRAVRG